MAPQVVGPEVDPHQGTCLSDHDPGRSISDGEYSLVSCSALVFEVILQPVGQLLGDKDHFCASPALGISYGKFLIIHIHGGEFQDLAYPHTTPSHELQNKTVSYLSGSKDDLVNHFFFMDLPRSYLSRSEKLFQHRGITRILELSIQVVSDEVKEGLEISVAGMLGELLAGIVAVG
jgi:hypothetical protein